MKIFYNTRLFLLIAFGVVVIAGCTKAKYDDDFKSADPPPIGDWTSSDDIAPESLVAYFPFEGNPNDSKNSVTGATLTGTGSYVEGIKGQAYQGAINSFISYTNPGAIKDLKSFTISFWVNTAKHDGGAQSVFMLSKESSFWGNFFMLIEGNTSPDDTMQVKVHFQNNLVPFIEHWIDPAKKYRPFSMYNRWKQLVITYDEITSAFKWYVNSQPINLPADVSIRRANPANDLLGALSFKDANRFVIGGFQQHLGGTFGAPDSWMLTYTGKLDEFRVYKKALTAKEIKALFIYERQGL